MMKAIRHKPTLSPRLRFRTGAALYVMVFSTTLIVSLLGLAGIAIVRIERLQAGGCDDMLRARLNARSAVELALRVIANDPNWRTTYSNGVETTTQALGANGRGTVSWILSDSDGSLTDGDTALRLKGIGRIGDVVQVSEVALPSNQLTCLEVSMHAQNLLTIAGSDILSSGTISSNNIVQESGGSNVNIDVEAVNNITGNDYFGNTTIGITPRTMPDSSVFDYYVANGTNISVLSLEGGGTRELKQCVLSPTSNPYGATNPQGIYVIDCLGLKVRIKDCRVVGTLVLLNPADTSEIGADYINWEPAVPNYPSLLVSGSIILIVEDVSNGLDESNTGNLNPPGTPFPYSGGFTDSDTADKWPSELKGLFYASGNISIELKDPKITGVVVSGQDLTIKRNTQIIYSPVFFSNPPPGFRTNIVRAIPGSWLRQPAP